MRKVMDYEHGFFGLWSPGGVCRVRIYTGDGETPVVVLTELEKNRNTSVTHLYSWDGDVNTYTRFMFFAYLPASPLTRGSRLGSGSLPGTTAPAGAQGRE